MRDYEGVRIGDRVRRREGWAADASEQERDRVGTVTSAVSDPDGATVEAVVAWFGYQRADVVPASHLEVLARGED